MRIVKINFEKLLNSVVFIVATTVILAQTILTIPKLNSYFCNLSNKEYVETFSTSELNKTAEVTFELDSFEPNTAIKILQNGEEIGCFTDKKITVTVYENSVLEIDGRVIKKPFTVNVIYDKSVDSKLSNKIIVDSNIAMVGRIFIK